jgi:hypothetical protein
LLAVIMSSIACRKTESAKGHSSFHPDYFVFGKNHLNCICNMIGISYYMMNDGKVYPEFLTDQLFSKNTAMPDSDYIKVQPLIDQLPDYLLEHPNLSVGCTNCTEDVGVLNIIAVTGADTVVWHINPDTTALPVEIRPYINLMQATWRQL